jgi:hypothetical protein
LEAIDGLLNKAMERLVRGIGTPPVALAKIGFRVSARFPVHILGKLTIHLSMETRRRGRSPICAR